MHPRIIIMYHHHHLTNANWLVGAGRTAPVSGMYSFFFNFILFLNFKILY